MFHLRVCFDLMHLVSTSRFMLLNATLWPTVTHTFQGNEPKFSDWTKKVCITPLRCFCVLLTSNWEVSTSCLRYSFIKFTQITKTFVISLFIDDLETNLPIRKHTLRIFAWYFVKIVRKMLLNASFMCLSRFVAFRVAFTIYAVERNVVVYCHAYN